MSGQIYFFRKSKADFGDPKVTATASQGNTFAKFAINRSNNSGWATTGSVDADNTTFEVDMTDIRSITNLIMINHNFKAFKVEYWTGTIWTDFSPAINETTNMETTNLFTFTKVQTQKLKLTITGTQVANAQKFLAQFLPLEILGQLDGWPVIKSPVLSRNRQKSTMLSGKRSIRENVGGVKFQLTVANWKSDADLTIIETRYKSNQGYLVWL